MRELNQRNLLLIVKLLFFLIVALLVGIAIGFYSAAKVGHDIIKNNYEKK